MISPHVEHQPPLDPHFIPAALWNREYRAEARRHSDRREATIQVRRPDATGWSYQTPLLPETAQFRPTTLRYGERLVKFLLWAWGGNHLSIHGAPELADHLEKIYSKTGDRAFDANFMGETCFLEPLRIESVQRLPPLSPPRTSQMNRDLSGCRIGFDLGGSDRKCASLIDGEVIFTEEIKWNPYFESDPDYHLEGIRDSLKRAAAKLPRVDAIGGSAAGIYIDSEPRVASLFRGIRPEDFDAKIRGIFRTLRSEWNDIPFVVANDGDVTALAGAMSLNEDAILGISMGTSEAAGYVDETGTITGWLNELAFAPVDYREDAPADEWSGDLGCGVQYFSQQAVGRLLPASRLSIDGRMSLPEQLEAVQESMLEGDERAAAIYETIGTFFGYSIAHYADFYRFRHLLLLGRVSSGEGGRIIQKRAEAILENEFPEMAAMIDLSMPDETMKRHGQAVAAASLPTFAKKG